MTGITQIKRCGGCHFGKIFGADLTKRLCWGMPPTAMQMPAPNGQMTLRMARPVVNAVDDACALFMDRSGADMVRDAQLMAEQAEGETKN